MTVSRQLEKEFIKILIFGGFIPFLGQEGAGFAIIISICNMYCV